MAEANKIYGLKSKLSDPCKCGIAKILQTSDQCQYSTR